jgi:cellulose synthase/poly-beta-1,6-N-acetylglucosamine synthase-like glycosyltransferase
MIKSRGVALVTPDQHALNESIHGLRLRLPDFSASRVLTGRQRISIIALLVVLAIAFTITPLGAGTALAGAVTLLYSATLVRNILMFRRLLNRPLTLEVSDEEARGIPSSALPVYTVLVPAFQEPQVIASTLEQLRRIDYPTEALDVKLLLEADDQATREAVAAATVPSYIEIVLVPPAQPRTKPKALNLGLRWARGDYLTIYDAEDRPDPLQLRRAVVAFASAQPNVACLQAKLSYHNPEQNLLTSWFALEYLTWFGFILPAIAAGRTPVPLGGTSTHFRTSVLRASGAWDPHNVTEDCDLGVRLYRMGYRTEILDSVTHEEANSDAVNWVRQRSRWVKGYAQTWLVHMRHPARLWRELGTRGFVGFNLMVGGATITSVLNLAMWTTTIIWFALHPSFLQAVFPDWVYYPAMLCILGGNFIGYYAGFLTAHASDRPDLLRAALLIPIYWVLISVAALRAFIQLLVSPFMWDKTVHGLDRTQPELQA